MHPPCLIKFVALPLGTGVIVASPSNPPKKAFSPTFFPGTGIIRTAVVFLLITPIAISSAIIPGIVDAGVSPGMVIISSPTEQTLVMASSFSRDSIFDCIAAAILESSETGINAEDNPPSYEEAKAPPFFIASFNIARAAVEPGTPIEDNPIL